MKMNSVFNKMNFLSWMTEGKTEEVEKLLKSGEVDPKESLVLSTQPLAFISASQIERVNMVKLLLWYGAPVDSEDKELERTALMLAASCGHVNIVRTLLECGADPNRTDYEGNTALMYAASTRLHESKKAEDATEIIELLTTHGVQPELKNTAGETALTLAASKGFNDRVQTLLDCGAHPEIPSQDTHGMGQTTENYAYGVGHMAAYDVSQNTLTQGRAKAASTVPARYDRNLAGTSGTPFARDTTKGYNNT